MTEIFPIVPAPAKAFWLLGGVAGLVAVICVAVTLLVGGAAWSARHARFEIGEGALRVRGDVYGRTLPAAELRVDEAARVDLARDASLAPTWRSFGTAVPGYAAGWFRLKNGERALLFVTDPSRVVRVPTTRGFSVYASVEDPEAFLEALRRLRRGGTRSIPPRD